MLSSVFGYLASSPVRLKKLQTIWLVLIITVLIGDISASHAQRADAAAADGPFADSTIVLEAPISLDFEPTSARVIAGFDTGETFFLEAAALAPGIVASNRDAMNRNDRARWWFAAPLRVPVGARRVVWVAIASAGSRDDDDALRGAKSNATRRVRSSVFTRPLSAFEGGVSQLRRDVAALSNQVAEGERQVREAEREVKNLRSKAELIGNFGRIIDAQEQLEATEEQIAQIAAKAGTVEEFIRKAQMFSAPRAGAAREQLLIKEISATADAATAAERSELERRARSDREAREMVVALEMARAPEAQEPGFIQKLNDELQRLIAAREKLEEQTAMQPVD